MNAKFILCAVKLLIVALVLPLKGNTQEIEKPLENSLFYLTYLFTDI